MAEATIERDERKSDDTDQSAYEWRLQQYNQYDTRGNRRSDEPNGKEKEEDWKWEQNGSVVEHTPMTISFSSEDAQGIQMPYDDALVIEAVINNFKVRKVLVDDGSKVNLLPYRVFQ